MSKMTIIQLLNKIANGEEIPNKFKYKGYVFEYDKDVKAYKDEDINPYFLDDYVNINHEYELNDEIEIIEDKKIEHNKTITKHIKEKEQLHSIIKEVRECLNKIEFILQVKEI